jgi:quercetin dioxygenase-like cupin family protein
MRVRNALAFASAFAVAAVVSAQGSGQGTTGTAAVIMPAADLKWGDLDPTGAPGVKSADVWGDHTQGAFGGFTKFPAGYVAPLHTHTNDLKIVVISGTFIHTPEGKPAARLGPGSYLMQSGGNYRHTTACDKASECLFFIQSTGKFDLIPVEKK